jgi:hypothetical protein
MKIKLLQNNRKKKLQRKNLRIRRRNPPNPHSSKPGESPGNQPHSLGSVKKLSTKNPTPHVAKDTTPVGGVNEKGQKRFIDPSTGKDAYIDMKKPRVMGPRGIPVKG